MKNYSHQPDRDSMLRAISVITGIAVNVLLSYVTYQLNLPIYLDTIGTIVVSALGGSFPGIMTAVMTNLICALFNSESIYYSIVNALIAMWTVWFVREKTFRSIKNITIYIAVAGALSGVSSALIQWRVLLGPQDLLVTDSATSLSVATGLPVLVSFWLVNILMNLMDKGVSLLFALVALYVIPSDIRSRIRNSGWRQRPLSEKEIESLRLKDWNTRHSLKSRITMILLAMSLVLVIIMGWVGVRLYFDNEITEKTMIAENAARFAASVIKPEQVDEFIIKGENAPGYKETEELLYKIRDNAAGVEYLYVQRVEELGSVFIFDLDEKSGYEEYALYEDERGYAPGEFVAHEEEIKPYLSLLLAGEEIPSIETKNSWNWMVTSYYPVLDADGKCVCYAGADASIDYLSGYMRNFLLHVFLIMLGIFVLILTYGLWSTGIYMVYPIHSIVMGVEQFIQAGSEQAVQDEAVKKLRKLDIHTGDELEKLYDAICDMALNQTEQMRSIRRFSDATVKMQDGLIITMADLVENRDSDTGAHIQKTAAYVKIIVEGLYKKGYYAEKITPKFMSDVVRSAPLHDIGKIHIPDNVLNKPGKLTDEEYEIMKTHTTAGKQIIEKAINTMEGANYLKEARNMAAYHHERWDGRGYPEGLHGEVIPLSARIMAVADVFDALTSPRVYKKPFPLEQALDMMQEGAGSQFDPKCVEVFMDSLPEVKVILRKYNETM